MKTIILVAQAVQALLAALVPLANELGASPSLKEKLGHAHDAAKSVADHEGE